MWDGKERRASDIELQAVLHSLYELKDSQRKVCERLDAIEKSVSMAEGAWWFLRYIIGPLVMATAGVAAYLTGFVERHTKSLM